MSAQRDVARALLFDDEGRIVMVHWRDPVTGHEFLEPPGGVREPGESFEETVRREIAEETGIVEVDVGDLLMEIDHAFTFAGEHYNCRERYFVCRMVGIDLRPTLLDPVEESGIVGVEWWTLEDLATQPPERLEPPQVLDMIRSLRQVPRDEHRG